MRSILFILILSVVSACSSQTNSFYSQYQVIPEDFGLSKDTFRIMTWNVKHFVDIYDNPYIGNRREDNPDTAALAEKAQLFAAALGKANADIVVLQEIENIQLAKQLSEDLFPELEYAFFADAESINWYQNVVVMSRFPLGVFESYGTVHSPVAYTDEEGTAKYETQSMINTRMWKVEVMIDADYGFHLVGVHLKAGRGPRNVAMRLGQIGLIKEQLADLYSQNKKANVIFTGDLNSYPGSEEMKSILEGVSGIEFIDPLPENVFTHATDDLQRRLDYIIINENMLPELVNGSTRVPMLLDREKMEKVSDHLPVVADFVAKEN